MLKIYAVVLELLAELKPVLAQVARADTDLARQLRRASASVALNLAEGMYSRGKLRAARYHTALGSARETLACVEVAAALGYVRAVPPGVGAKLNRVVGTLVKLVGVG